MDSNILVLYLNAMKVFFELGYIPQRDELLEFTPEQYLAYRTRVEEPPGKLFMLAPKNYKYISTSEIEVIQEHEIVGLAMAALAVKEFCQQSGYEFKTVEDELSYVATQVPAYLTQGTPYEQPERDAESTKEASLRFLDVLGLTMNIQESTDDSITIRVSAVDKEFGQPAPPRKNVRPFRKKPKKRRK